MRAWSEWMSYERGAWSDWATQQWVKLTGRRTDLLETPWLDGPIGEPSGIGGDFFERWSGRTGLRVERGGGPRGLLPHLDVLAGPSFDPSAVHPAVRRFYEETSEYELEAWSEWSGVFRPFGRALARLFSRRLQQLNVPLSGLDTSAGMTSDVFHILGSSGEVAMTAWVRHLRHSGNVLYAGSYSVVRVPGHENPCIRVVFPLPHGNANVVLRPSADDDGALTVLSKGRAYGDPGFYFTLHRPGGRMWMKYVRTMRESIRVYPGDNGDVRADHTLWIFGLVFLRLHYRMRLTSDH